MSDFYCEQVIPGKVEVDVVFETEVSQRQSRKLILS